MTFSAMRPIFALVLLCAATYSADAADATPGKALFEADCANCHTLRSDEAAKRGPHLQGLFTRRYGAVDGFPYRMVWTQANPVWTAKHLDDYLVIHGRYDAPDRALLIEYLNQATQP